jgi:lipopolysaccharide/colanic/teichoic acid biosynthesis glycosyltransferase
VLVLSEEAMRSEAVIAAASSPSLRGLRVRRLQPYFEEQFAKIPLGELSPSSFLFDVAEKKRARIYGGVKRISELVLAIASILLSAPLMAAIAVVVRLSSGKPVLFRQERVGKDGQVFSLVKFRTMRAAPPAAEPDWAAASLDRITAAGRVLRRYHLDELPQLWHVLRGQLSLVGPRPEQPRIVERLTQSMEFYGARHVIRPGLTGWAQINYGYGGTLQGAAEKLQYDFFYIKHQSLRLDLKILGSTLRTILAGGGE